MNWVTVIWSILIGACAAMALPSLFLASGKVGQWICFSVESLSEY